MGRFHRHDDDHSHDHSHTHDHPHGPELHDGPSHDHLHMHEHDHPHTHAHELPNSHMHVHIHGFAAGANIPHIHLHFDCPESCQGHCHEYGHGHGHCHSHGHGHGHSHEHGHTRGSISVAGADAQSDVENSEYGDHSGYETGHERIEILEGIFDENDRRADSNRQRFDEHGVEAINLMSSPGAGKTAVLEKTLAACQGKLRVGIVEGDIETALDADRLRGYDAQIALLNTGKGFGGECHLDAPMVARALNDLDLSTLDLVFIENVGNLVCPAEFEVGEQRKAMVYSITEGEDKPAKYPVMFRAVQAVVINKIDLAPHLDFDMALFRENLEKVNPGVPVFEVSAKTGEGLAEWLRWVYPSLAED